MDLKIEWIRNNLKLIEQISLPKIPLKLHMIWVGDNSIPDYVINNYVEWKKLMPHWEIRLWQNEDINLNEFSQDVIKKIHTANKGAQKADIMRYFIIEKYGGFYVDSDIIPARTLDPLVYMDTDMVLYHDNDVTWNYIINCFFGSSPHHPLMKEVCLRVMNAELNTSDINIKTGPYLWGTVISEVKPDNGKQYYVLNYPFFSNFHNPPDKLGTHKYAASWVD